MIMAEVTAGAEGNVTPAVETPSLSPENRLAQLFGARIFGERPKTDEAKPDTAVSSSADATAPAETPESSAEAATPDAGVETETEAAQAPAETAPPRWDSLPDTIVGKLKIDGQEVEVTLGDMKKGFSFQSHNTKVSQKLADDRKAFEAVERETRELRERYAQALPQVEAFLTQQGESRYANVDWQRLARENPDEFTRMRAEYDLYREQMELVARERQAEEQTLTESHQKELQAAVERETALAFEKIPAWRDEQVRIAELQAMFEFASNMGFERDVLLNTFDHRTLMLIRSAYLYDKQQKDVEAARLKRDTKPAVKTVAPGVNEPEEPITPESKRLGELKRRLQKSGRVEDAAALFGAIRSR
jgi:phage host-nuclease inhibitor protein Gam